MTSLLRGQRARPGAALVAVLVVLCQATAWVHTAASPHVTCAEHGESVHIAAATPATEERQNAAGTTLDSAPAETATHAHEHCGLQGQRTTGAPGPDATFVRVAHVASFAPDLASAPRSVGLLRLAPKTSPPRTPVA